MPSSAPASADGPSGAEARVGRGEWRIALATGAIGTLLLLVADLLVRDEPTPRGDDLIYELMARDPFAEHTFPFAFRFGVPTLVHVLPFEHTFSFQLLAYLATGAAAALLYVLLRRFRVPVWLAAGLGLCLAVSPPLLIVALRQGRNVDPQTVLVMIAGALAIVDRRPLLLGVVMLLGATVRESALFLAPLAYAVWAERVIDLRVARRTVAATAPALAAYVAIRLAVPTVGREQVPGYGSGAIQGRIDVLRDGLEDIVTQGRRMVTIYGPLWLAAPLALRDLPFARRGLVLVALCGVAMTFALDWGRIILLAAPVFYVAGAWTLRSHPRLGAAALAAFALLDVVYAVYMQVEGVQSGIIDVGPPAYPVR